jgi:hypothetical protein
MLLMAHRACRQDTRLARHIVHVHKLAGKAKEGLAPGEVRDSAAAADEQLKQLGGWVQPTILRAYIAHAKTFEDQVYVPEELTGEGGAAARSLACCRLWRTLAWFRSSAQGTASATLQGLRTHRCWHAGACGRRLCCYIRT